MTGRGAVARKNEEDVPTGIYEPGGGAKAGTLEEEVRRNTSEGIWMSMQRNHLKRKIIGVITRPSLLSHHLTLTPPAAAAAGDHCVKLVMQEMHLSGWRPGPDN